MIASEARIVVWSGYTVLRDSVTATKSWLNANRHSI